MKKKWMIAVSSAIVIMAVAAIWSPGKQEQEQAEPAVEKNKPVVEQIDSVKEHVAEKEAESKEATTEETPKETPKETAIEPAEQPTSQVTEIPAEANELLKEAEKEAYSEQAPAPKAETGSTDSGTGGLRFSSREEAMQFVLSRFSKEEIVLYNKVSANGLTAEQQQMALQIAYSRFSAEEIAAIEAALK
ncbi:hypothetical protein RRU94_10290 [Domibacillus sp. DTU_2020_1001157_1_SI_ALB_TIR_016]|uniref:hypothetical protein n=1 Tax=Domibacillus sp. DTU_2020_1001157_1_SI_ALB_TIR_016 TaxID=3077789 RepID=UPI0028EF2BA4|nr:hypothetical protein [Domibacillus sp. DTU_2020_1001157_1_SI_ALB_TIR_016]WNS81191.1 hypothetical protein RRU94_10290 [Domibacillus sp. DTU_2020_1001157_1_SI_ALB_TIR_016]